MSTQRKPEFVDDELKRRTGVAPAVQINKQRRILVAPLVNRVIATADGDLRHAPGPDCFV